MSTEFDSQIHFDLRMRVKSNTKPEVLLSHRGRHLEIVDDAIIPPRVGFPRVPG